MSDDIDIREGGVVAVDTGSLRAAADRYAVLGARVREVAEDLGAQARAVSALGPAAAYGGSVPYRLQNAAFAAESHADDLAGIARDLRELADTYEIVELRARRAMAVGVDARAAAAQAADLAAQRHPDAARRADLAIRGRDMEIGAGLVSAANGGVGLAGGVAGIAYPQLAGAIDAALLSLPVAAQSLQALIRRLGTGTIPPGRRLSGDAAVVEVRQEGGVTVTASPRDLAGALSRIPDATRVRVETYTMPDGTAKYAVYLAGTRDFPPEAGDDPWDLSSDTRMYLGEDAAAYAAVVQALDDVGVPLGAELYLFGHSQGGLIADWLAVQGGYHTRLLVTAGSPTEADVGPGTLSVQLRHTDDLVQSLAAGGSDERVGAAGSLVVERAGDPAPGIQDLSFAPHRLAAYVATAKMLDAAPDPRTGPMRSALAELRGATSVTAVEYDARRVPRQAAKGGGGL
ncbi:hypothetical protein GH740_03660 [Microbacterium sp. SYP-A9085]|uniref:hypothetical protein n=1 Tax=Microbacterium sp. SYP-A9085 TaxID=2664454 RepID=UPI00129A6747|nr:hypothetical protein [Microbacterium sp. SYP-A9085]MRH28408.1 hypothetical protein [Microbacterium sp. SYP-A9085]